MNNNTHSRLENYREFLTKEYLMGPDSLRLLDEILRKYPLMEGSRVMDLGCGMGITSMFLAKEAKVNVFATDLWISATQNAENFRKWGIDEQVIPIHADANDLPYAEQYFDAIVSIDAFVMKL
ncbi:MAG: methyltransferase domain-containing protein [Lachnospiraceae bacterium]|nr:methyltransferase domain-containing protein [Lachnospiraceae bacterium]